MESWGDAVGEGVKNWAIEHLKNPKKLADVFQSIRTWFRKDPAGKGRQILIIGPGGVGKTTLGHLLAGQSDVLESLLGKYEESIATEKFALKGDSDVEVIIPPGQEHRRYSTWDDLLQGIASGAFRGIILVGAYGFHSLGDFKISEHKLYKSGESSKQFVRRYTTASRKDELGMLETLAPYLLASTQKMWLLTVITKQDLWWKERDAVEQFYRDGKYGLAVQNLLNQKDQRSYRQELLFCSLTISNFVTGRDENLQDNAGGYDERQRLKSVAALAQTLDALRRWEEHV